jgi:6-phosphogluconolactonase (cycloisomerase 2 family)
MRLLRPAALLLLLTASGCGVNQRLNAPLASDPAMPAIANRGLGDVLFTMTNSTAGNAILTFARSADGTLAGPSSTPTGGTGSGAGLGSQGAIVAGVEDRMLFAVDAGSHDIAALRVTPQGLRALGTTPSGGQIPISLTRYGSLLFVLNAGGAGNIAGFRVGGDGRLTPVAGSVRGLGGMAVGPAQVGFTPDGRHLVVTEKATNSIAVFEVNADGSVSDPQVVPSAAHTPFGFAFGRSSALIVSEAAGGAPMGSSASSYHVGPAGDLMTVSAAVPTHQTSACWVAVPAGGAFAYTTNAAGNSVSGYRVGTDGALTLLDADGHTAAADGSPIDAAFDASGSFLYVLNGMAHSVNAYRRENDGHLVPLQGASGLPAGGVGLAAF